ncbi:MAG: TM2 domain-containing membrane protein YozV [Pseudoalteromonas rhizosphaerae]|jgi:TM2 domain-containing membrane protein YozV|uniref:TM2 domain-containing protein n=1 Tax=Pseudoalteromonas neustonica TaxID=1840331 RepID=A0ABY3FA61_9GAMM|nr:MULTISPECIES: TM2 domain-containing protein [Pseudoalteromonas]MBB1300795.1 TM2 domain-containing protein [Pseudoalteromonas sp. SR44-8]MBB1505641.1 TM2 domain-containing protein [Pseudoalteromonas sp. SG41-1]TVU81223.1 TM2 domain-containing protein [Pseudoalteromonas neustonica]
MTSEQLNAQEEQLRSEVNALSPEQRKLFYQQEKRLVKDPDTYAVLNWFFAAGLHHFYLGKFQRGAVNLTLMLIGILTIYSFGVFLIIVVLLIELPQLFKSQRIVHQYNNQVMADILKQLTDS